MNIKILSKLLTFAILILIGFYTRAFFFEPNHINLKSNEIETSSNKNSRQVNTKLNLNSNTIADIASCVAPSVVNIDISKTYTINTTRNPFGHLDFFFGPNSSPFEMFSEPQQYQRKGSGSGFIIAKDGFILTNNHVVGQADEIVVTLNDKRKFKGKVWGRDNLSDLALVKIDATNLVPAKLGQSKNIRPGDFVIAIGSPLGLDHSVTFGIVSALGRSLGELNNSNQLIQTDAAINPGNSGGPLLNLEGEVIGINTAIRGDGQNIGFAIPIDIAKTACEELLKHKKIMHPYVGIVMQSLDSNLAQALGIDQNIKGVVVARVNQGSPASTGGLEQGDVILKVDGKSVETPQDVQNIIRSHKVGDTVKMAILRSNSMSAVSITIGEYPENINRNE